MSYLLGPFGHASVVHGRLCTEQGVSSPQTNVTSSGSGRILLAVLTQGSGKVEIPKPGQMVIRKICRWCLDVSHKSLLILLQTCDCCWCRDLRWWFLTLHRQFSFILISVIYKQLVLFERESWHFLLTCFPSLETANYRLYCS